MTTEQHPYQPPFFVLSGLLFTAFSIALYLDLLLGFRHFAHDTLSYNYPIRSFLSDVFRQGTFPWWDSWNSPGFPYSLLQAERFYPPFLVLGTLFSYTPSVFLLELILSTLWCLAGTYLWLRRQNASRPIAHCGAMAYAGSGPLVTSFFSYPIQVSMFHIPWLFLAADLLSRPSRGWRDTSLGTALAVISAWLMLTGGYITVTYMAFLIVILYAVAQLLADPTRIRAFLAGGSVAVLLLASFVFLPAVQYLQIVQPFMDALTQRNLGSSFSPFEGSLPPLAPLSFLLANASYLPGMLAGRAEQMYFGATIALAVPATLCREFTDRRQFFFLAMAAAVILLSMRGSVSPAAALAVKMLPMLDKMRLHVFWSVFAVFFLVTAGCRGLTTVTDRTFPPKSITRYQRRCIAAAAAVVAITGILRSVLPYENEWDIVLTPYDYFVYAVGILTLGCLLLVHSRTRIVNTSNCGERFRHAVLSCLISAAVVSTATAVYHPTLAALATKLQSARWPTMPSAMFLMDLLQLSIVLMAIINAFRRRDRQETAISLLILATFLDMTLAAHRYHHGKPYLYGTSPPVVSTRTTTHSDNTRSPESSEGSLAFETRRPQIRGYFRLYAPHIADLAETPQGDRLLSRLLWFHPGEGPVTMASWTKAGEEPVIRSIRLELDSLTAAIQVKGQGTIFWTDMWSPGWTAIVDGVPQHPIKTMDLFKGVRVVGPKITTVIFRYRPPFHDAGKMIFATAILILISLMCYGLAGRKKRLQRTVT